jgi:glycosyltransferase involved in cell wall biosynthesis
VKPVAVTIIANNYVPMARVLCASFLQHHPNGEFFCLIVDELQKNLLSPDEKFRVVQLHDLRLPHGDLFLYQYSILELSTAVKPFLLRYLFDTFALESALYLDPDLLFFAPLTSVYDSLQTASIVLIPHMLVAPPDDGEKPSERDIMYSGVYNLGFLGLRNDDNARELLEWWGERLASRCVVDVANALFVDQRWMDLAPAYFEGVKILRDPALNVAYWNLHERTLHQSEGRYYVNGKPLVFFHFSGFDPSNRTTLSKHQTRHSPQGDVALGRITKLYAELLFEAGHAKFNKIQNAFLRTDNGVSLGRLTQAVVRSAVERGIQTPSPKKDSDAFCRFLMAPNRHFDRRGIAPLLAALGEIRSDVRAAFPGAFESVEQAQAIREWVRTSGGQEENLSELFQQYGHLLDRSNVVDLAVKCWRKRPDLKKAFPEAFANIEGSQKFAAWIERYGTVEETFARGDGEAFLLRRKGLLRVLMLYFQDVNLQKEFPFLFVDRFRTAFVRWLYAEACPRNIVSADDAAWFDGFAETNREAMAALTFGYSSWLLGNLVGGGTIYDLRNVKDMLHDCGVRMTDNQIATLYCSPLGRSLVAQAEQHYFFSPALRQEFPSPFSQRPAFEGLMNLLFDKVKSLKVEEPSSGPRRTPGILTWFAGIRNARIHSSTRYPAPDREQAEKKMSGLPAIRDRLRERAKAVQLDVCGINLAGYFHAPTGMGESARSMARTLAGGGMLFKEVPLPSYYVGPWLDLDVVVEGRLLREHEPSYRTNIVVANGDDFPHVRSRLPFSFWAERRNIGYWVWETEMLPNAHSDCEHLSEIWTPSDYSASAIRQAVPIPVRTVPHVLDFNELDECQSARMDFGIPEDLTAYGYLFDCKSVIERKNPIALLQAFRLAFGTGRDEAVLVVKVSSPEAAKEEYELLRRAAEGLNVIWITDLLPRAETLRLVRSLDVYVSLHRSEGFGLTLAESMAMGIPVIATGYSGNVDFMDESNSCLVRSKVIETEKAFGAYPLGTRWAEPNVEHAAGFMRSLLNGDDRKKIGSQGSHAVRERLAPHVAGRLVSDYLRFQHIQSSSTSNVVRVLPQLATRTLP